MAVAKKSGCRGHARSRDERLQWLLGFIWQLCHATQPPRRSARVCLCPAEVTLARANGSTPKKLVQRRQKQEQAGWGCTRRLFCIPVPAHAGHGVEEQPGMAPSSSKHPSCSSQLAQQAGDQDTGQKGAHHEQQISHPRAKTLSPCPFHSHVFAPTGLDATRGFFPLL